MSKSGNKLWLVLAVSGLVGVIGAIYLVRIVGDYSTEKVVTGQVNDWAKLWASARVCVTGDDTTMAAASHAFLLYEATYTRLRDRMTQCDPFIRKLKRPGKEATGVAKVEKSWDNVREATKKLAKAYVGMVDLTTRKRMGPRRADMVAALDGMDAAYAKLRADSSMSAPKLPGAGRPAQLALGTPVAVEDAPLSTHFVATKNGALLLYGQTADGRSLQVVMRGSAVEAKPQGNGADLAADDALWGVWSEMPADNLAELRGGDLDAGGTPQQPGVIVTKASAPETTLQVRFALGSGAVRVVVFETLVVSDFSETSTGISMVRSTDGGKTYGAPVAIAARVEMLRDDFAHRRVDIAWVDDQGAMLWLPIRADNLQALPPPRRLFASSGRESLLMCAHGDATWWLRNASELYVSASDEAGVRQVQLPQNGIGNVTRIAGCTAERVVFSASNDGGASVHTCDARKCERPMDVPLASGSQFADGMTASGAPVAITQVNQLLVVRRPGAEPKLYMLPAPEPGLDGVEHALRGVIDRDGEARAVITATDPKTGAAQLSLVALP